LRISVVGADERVGIATLRGPLAGTSEGGLVETRDEIVFY
jgi:hypothetical protein